MNPLLPLEITVAIPACRRNRMIGCSTLPAQGALNFPPPSLMLIDVMRRAPKLLRIANTRCSPSSWSEV